MHNGEAILPCSMARALSPSLRFMNATKPQLRPRCRASSVRGHMILTLASGPYLPNISHNCCSDIYQTTAQTIIAANNSTIFFRITPKPHISDWYSTIIQVFIFVLLSTFK